MTAAVFLSFAGKCEIHPLMPDTCTSLSHGPTVTMTVTSGHWQVKRVASEAVRDGLREIGRGAGPVNALGLGVRVA